MGGPPVLPIWDVATKEEFFTKPFLSDAKTAAREYVFRALTALKGPFFCLPGLQLHDFFLAHLAGIPSHHVFGCERHAAAAKRCCARMKARGLDRYAGGALFLGSSVKAVDYFAAKHPHLQFSVVNLDFCGRWYGPNKETLERLLAHDLLAPGCHLFLTVSIGDRRKPQVKRAEHWFQEPVAVHWNDNVKRLHVDVAQMMEQYKLYPTPVTAEGAYLSVGAQPTKALMVQCGWCVDRLEYADRRVSVNSRWTHSAAAVMDSYWPIYDSLDV